MWMLDWARGDQKATGAFSLLFYLRHDVLITLEARLTGLLHRPVGGASTTNSCAPIFIPSFMLVQGF